MNRRNFLTGTVGGGIGIALAPLIPGLSLAGCSKKVRTPPKAAIKTYDKYEKFKLPVRAGMGGAPLGNGMKEISDEDAVGAVAAAWKSGVRYFDTSPLYGYGLSEHRFGEFLNNQDRSEFIISTKVGRVFKAYKKVEKSNEWLNPAPFSYTYDFTAAGTRRSIEDSLMRLNIESIDIAFVHDLEPENVELGNWRDHFEIARKGAFQELSKMRSEGLIKSWGLGVNQPEPILAALQVADPDIMLAANQYSLMVHEEALSTTFPACQARGVGVVIGTPLNNGFLAGAERFNWSTDIPPGYKEKRAKMNALAEKHGIDLRTAALQFCAANPAVAAVIPGARYAWQAEQNFSSMSVRIPPAFWSDMKSQNLIAATAPVPD